MKILVACEESQAVTIELRKRGHEAYSCDIEPCSGGHPEWHLQQDVTPLLKQKWDMIIAFPPCTYLSTVSNKYFNVDEYGDKAIQRHRDRNLAADFFMLIANADCAKIAIENPVGVMSTRYRKPDQIINPYQFGDSYEKRTCLWLKGLPKLKSTDMVGVPQRQYFPNGRSLPTWYSKSGKDRAKIRSKTFPGIALAMAEQWAGKM